MRETFNPRNMQL